MIEQRLQAAALLHRQGQLSQAEAAYRAIILEWPIDSRPHYFLAQVLQDAKQISAAIEAAKRAIELKPDFAEAYNNLGILYADQDKIAEAIQCFEQAIKQRPGYARAYNNLGNSLRTAGRLVDAAAALAQAVALQPDYDYAYHNYGIVLKDLGLYQEAEQNLRRALRLQPRRRESYLALGGILRQQVRLDEAIQIYQQAIRLEPANNTAEYTALGHVLAERGDTELARQAYSSAIKRSPDHLAALLGQVLTLPPIMESAEHIRAQRAQFTDGLHMLSEKIDLLVSNTTYEKLLDSLKWVNFYLAYHGEDDKALQISYANLVGALLDRMTCPWRQTLDHRPIRQPIKVGFVSSFFTESTVGMYFRSWVLSLPRDDFEVYVYHLKPGKNLIIDEMSQQVHTVRHLPTANVATLAGIIFEDRLDLLIYPELGMDATCFVLAALRLAPIQCAAWGHPVTTGHATIDYYFSSAAMEPADADDHYSEWLIRLPGIGTAYAKPVTSVSKTRADFGLPENKPLLLCPQSLFKIHPDNDALFAAVLSENPDALLVFSSGRHPVITDRFMRRLEKTFSRYGLSIRERTRVLPYLDRADYLCLNKLADVMLDTLHWSGGNTSLDALACGLPIVTLPGKFMRGRQSYGMLSTLNATELIALDQDSYIKITGELIRDQNKRRYLGEKITSGHAKLFDDLSTTSAFRSQLHKLRSLPSE